MQKQVFTKIKTLATKSLLASRKVFHNMKKTRKYLNSLVLVLMKEKTSVFAM